MARNATFETLDLQFTSPAGPALRASKFRKLIACLAPLRMLRSVREFVEFEALTYELSLLNHRNQREILLTRDKIQEIFTRESERRRAGR